MSRARGSSAARALVLTAALLGPCWLGPVERRQLLGTLGTTLGAGVWSAAVAEEAAPKAQEAQSATRDPDPYLELVQSRSGDFVIQLPANWIKDFNDYPGRLIMSMDPLELQDFQQNKANELVVVRCARLALPSLLRSVQYMPRAGDDTRSDWKEVALGQITAQTIAEWLMRAGLQAQAAQMGMQAPQIDFTVVDAEISDGPAPDQSVLTWHARSQVQVPAGGMAGQDPNMQVQGLGGKNLMTISDAMGRTGAEGEAPPPLATTGRAILRKGAATFVVIQSPSDRIEASYQGRMGKKYLDYIAQSLKLTPGAS